VVAKYTVPIASCATACGAGQPQGSTIAPMVSEELLRLFSIMSKFCLDFIAGIFITLLQTPWLSVLLESATPLPGKIAPPRIEPGSVA